MRSKRASNAGASGFSMAHYVSQPRIEGPIWLEPSDIYFLQTRIAETETGVETLEEQISKLTLEDETQLSELICIRDAKLVEISSLRNTLSPIRRIPGEILSEILELSCIPASGIFTADCEAFPSLVSSVCVAWRRAALADPRMWSTICLSLRRHHKGNIFIRIKEWISRSQGHSLDLHLDLHTLNDNPLKDKEEDVLNCILEFRHQIRSIQMRAFPMTFLPLFRLPCSSLPSLEKVFIDVYPGPVPNLSHDVEAFLGAPKLQNVAIRDSRYVSILELLVLPHEQLASLEIHLDRVVPDFAIYRHTLCQCINLISLKVDFQIKFGLDFSIYLPTLKNLDITYGQALDSIRNTINLLHGLTTPLLEHLTLHWHDQDIQGLCTDLVGLQSRSSAPLSSLTLMMENSDYNITPTKHFVNRFTLILAAFPTLRSFQLRDYEAQRNRCLLNALIRSMIYTRDRWLILPNLTYFELCIRAESEYPPDMAPMLSSRRCPYKPDVDAVNDTFRVPQPDVLVFRFQSGGQPTAQYIDIMDSQCILP